MHESFEHKENNMVRNILAVVAGFIVGGLFVFAFEAIGHMIYPLPPGLDSSKPEMIAEYVRTAPIGAIMSVLAAQSAGSFFGGLVTGLIAVSRKQMVAVIYGVLALIMALINMIMISHPVWFMVLSVLLPIPLALLGSRVAGLFVKGAR